MLSQQELSDRFEIQDLLFDYADAIDSKRFDDLRDIFSEDAHIDYSAVGGAVGGREDIIAFLAQALPNFPNFQHLNANFQVRIDGDSATGRVMCFNPTEVVTGKDDKGKPTSQVFMLGVWYRDRYVRTSQGWRICERIEEKSWQFNVPGFMRLAD